MEHCIGARWWFVCRLEHVLFICIACRRSEKPIEFQIFHCNDKSLLNIGTANRHILLIYHNLEQVKYPSILLMIEWFVMHNNYLPPRVLMHIICSVESQQALQMFNWLTSANEIVLKTSATYTRNRFSNIHSNIIESNHRQRDFSLKHNST